MLRNTSSVVDNKIELLSGFWLHTAACWLSEAAFMTLVNKVSEEALSEALAFKTPSGDTALRLAATWQSEEAFIALLGKADKAADFGVFDLNNKEVWSEFHRGAILSKLDLHEEALEAYDRVIELNPNEARYHNNRRIVLEEIKKNRFGDGVSLTEELLEKIPPLCRSPEIIGGERVITGFDLESLMNLGAAIWNRDVSNSLRSAQENSEEKEESIEVQEGDGERVITGIDPKVSLELDALYSRIESHGCLLLDGNLRDLSNSRRSAQENSEEKEETIDVQEGDGERVITGIDPKVFLELGDGMLNGGVFHDARHEEEEEKLLDLDPAQISSERDLESSYVKLGAAIYKGNASSSQRSAQEKSKGGRNFPGMIHAVQENPVNDFNSPWELLDGDRIREHYQEDQVHTPSSNGNGEFFQENMERSYDI